MDSSPEPEKEPYKVGPGKPPIEHQFKPGNPGGPGMPKGHRTMKTILQEIYDTEIIGIDPKTNEPRKMTMGEAIAMGQFKMAAKGNTKAFNAIMDRLEGKVALPISGPDGSPLTMFPPQINLIGVRNKRDDDADH